MHRSVAITGVGAVSGLGVGREGLWAGLDQGRSALGPIRRFDASGFPTALAAEVLELDPREALPRHYRKAVKIMSRDIEQAVVAAHDAVIDARLTTRAAGEVEPTYRPERLACHIGAGLIAAEPVELTAALVTAVTDTGPAEAGGFDLRAWGERGMNSLPPLWMLKYLPNMLACHVTIVHGAEGPSNTITCAEASGLMSIGEAARVIERDTADAAIAGGAEAKVSPMGLVRMALAGRLAATDSQREGWRLVRPYDAEATGGLLGEGGGIVILERTELARRRGVTVYAELAGFGCAQSVSGAIPPAMETDWQGLADAIDAALSDAELPAAEIDAIVPGAWGVPELDAAEAAALRHVFGRRLAEIPLVTLTPNLGHCAAGHGGLQVVVAARCLRDQWLPPRLHAGRPADDLRAESAPARSASLGSVLVCASAMGGQHAALVLRAA